MNYICPHCGTIMKCSESASRFTYSCETKQCSMPLYKTYVLSTDNCGTMYHVSILIKLDHLYHLLIDFKNKNTFLEKLQPYKNGTTDSVMPESMMWIDESIPFNFDKPKESAEEIISRLLGLKAFI